MSRKSPKQTLPFTQWFWADYESDQALRLCSPAAQGVWMRILCVCAMHEPYGYFAIQERALDVEDVARLTGIAETEAAALVEELGRNGVYSRDRKGRIYNRRMVRDHKKAQIARKNGKKGGNPSLRKQKENPASDNPSDKGGVKPQSPESRVQTLIEERESPSRTRSDSHRADMPDAPPPIPPPVHPPGSIPVASDETAHAVALLDAARAGLADGGCPPATPPGSGDLATARTWLASGVDSATARIVARGVAERRAAKGQGPPTTLAYLTRPVMEAAATPAAVTPMRGTSHDRRSRSDSSATLAAYRDAAIRAVARSEGS